MKTKIAPSYLFQEYADDENLQLFIDAYNTIAQGYLDWFVNINLPIYTGLSSPLLDWVGLGVYGIPRPYLTSGAQSLTGPLNTEAFNQAAVNYDATINNLTPFIATDDVYKRVITWVFYKGDGMNFNAQWLKRRIIRFLYGTNGQDVLISSVYGITVSISGVNVTVGIVTANLLPSKTINGQIQYGNGGSTPANLLYLAEVMSAAYNSGAIKLPFQYNFTFNVS